VLYTGIAWQHLPQELGFGSGVTCWRRLDEWQRAGVWDQLHAVLLARLRAADQLDWSKAIADSSQVQADAVPAVCGAVGCPRRRPDCIIADRGYDHEKYRRLLRERGIRPVIARRETEHGSGLGRHRWVVERTFAWLHQFKRLLVRYERRAEMHKALLGLACSLVCFRRLTSAS
jgi:transposase